MRPWAGSSPASRWVALVIALTGCGGPRSSSETVEAWLSGEEASVAAQRAPDLHAAAVRAWQDAQKAEQRSDLAAARDHATRGRLWAQAAIAESRRVELEEKRLAIESETRGVEAARQRDLQAQRQARRRQNLAQAAEVAKSQAELALARARDDEPRRFRGRDPARDRAAVVALSQRARLLVAAARSLNGGVQPEEEPVKKLLDRASGARSADRSIDLADQAVALALAALGKARSQANEVRPEELASLAAAAEARGFEVQSLPEGLTVRVMGDLRRQVRQVASLLRAHPHGPVQLRLAQDRGTRERLVRAGVPETRLQVERADVSDVEVVFVAYVPALTVPSGASGDVDNDDNGRDPGDEVE